MKEIKYNGDLIDDINMAAKGINCSDIVTNDMLNKVVSSISRLTGDSIFAYLMFVIIPSFFQMQGLPNILFKILSIVYVSISAFDLTKNSILLKKHFKQKKKRAIKNLYRLSSNLLKEKNYVLSKENYLSSDKQDRMICYTDKEENKIMIDKKHNCEEQYIYMLDRYDRIRVLKQYRARLVLLEEDEVINFQKCKSLNK